MNLPNEEESVEIINSDLPVEGENPDQDVPEEETSNVTANALASKAGDVKSEEDVEEPESQEEDSDSGDSEILNAELQDDSEEEVDIGDSEVESQADPADGDSEPEAQTKIDDVADEQIDVSQVEESDEQEETETDALPPEEEDGREWYVVHCYSGYENKVRHNLEQRIETMGMKDEIFDVVVPTEEEVEVKDGKRRTIERRVFPGYILVNMILTEESWYVVRNTPGVTSFVGMGNEPVPLRPEEVAQIIKRMEADAPRIKVTFKQGERVRIIDGPFNDFRGTVDEIDMERAKVRVMVNFFGRETPVELDFLQVEKS
jgi:transcriptional antiterminator NusG